MMALKWNGLILACKDKNKVHARMYFAKSKQLSALRIVCNHIRNLLDGVLHVFQSWSP